MLSSLHSPVSLLPCLAQAMALPSWADVPTSQDLLPPVLPLQLPLTSATFPPPQATLWATSAAFSQEPWHWLGVELRSLAKLGKLSLAPYLPFITGVTP